MNEPLVCRTCLQPKAPLIEEGGLLFCKECLAGYRFLMDWMQGKHPKSLNEYAEVIDAKWPTIN